MLPPDDPQFDEPGWNKPLIGVAIVVVIAAFASWYYWHRQHVQAAAGASMAAPAAPAQITSPSQADDSIEHPVPAAAPAEPLPALAESDGAIAATLGDALGPSATQFLVPDSLIRHIVVTVDNMPRQKIALAKRPVMPAPGALEVNGDELHATLDPQNYERYQAMVGALQQADMQRVAAVYLKFYPLFQSAYQDLGYPNGYFNDRLVQVIDLLLATPQSSEPIDLVRPNVLYVFADPALEALPAGQKLLIRMGPENERAVKSKLMELRAIITAAPPKR